jgi:RimJ/RimL family protein N-acetyltransferase
MIDFDFGVKLDRIYKTDLEAFRINRNSFTIRKWCRQKDLIHEDEQYLWFERQMSDPTIEMYSICRSDDGSNSLVGVAGLTSIDVHNRVAEFSCYIFPKFHRRGFARMALATLFNHGFHNRGLNRIWGETFEGNPAASLFEALGMIREGTQRQNYFKSGKFLDSHIYGLLVEDWINTEYNRYTEF